MRCNWRRWFWGIMPVIILGWVAVQAEHGRIEQDLTERAATALSKRGASWAVAAFNGRDVVLAGRAPDEDEPAKAANLLRSIWGVRIVENRADLLEKADNYTWVASRRNHRIRLSGFAPSLATRTVIVGVAKANFPGFEVVDRMSLARGIASADTWLAGVSFALKQLATLKRGDVRLDDLGVSVMGEAEDAANYRAVKSALASGLPKGIKLVNDQVTAPVVSPYTWSAQFGNHRVILEGYVTNNAVRQEVLTGARSAFSGTSVVDKMEYGEGAPNGWPAAAVGTLQALARLDNGSLELKDGVMTISGLSSDNRTAEAVRAQLHAALPATIKPIDHISIREQPPVVSPSPVGSSTEIVISAPPPPAIPPLPRELLPPPIRLPATIPGTDPPGSSRTGLAMGTAEAHADECKRTLAHVSKSGQILFRLSSADLDRPSFEVLDKLAAAAKFCRDMRIEVAGHASSEGNAELNQQLSVKRAQSVVSYLVRAGVDATQLKSVGYGATRPVVPNDTPENMAKNRRIEFAIGPR